MRLAYMSVIEQLSCTGYIVAVRIMLIRGWVDHRWGGLLLVLSMELFVVPSNVIHKFIESALNISGKRMVVVKLEKGNAFTGSIFPRSFNRSCLGLILLGSLTGHLPCAPERGTRTGSSKR